ncbi:MarR family winged helix-turn-helix transcriptional regulator [Sphingomonas sp. BAUL-RG-20F-R05-02]|uniref:MarR family winged helix-turn-helix transcriptional regulator n=1 Tax=Sphingomonas sp. BAUL-RG-20F-R05-02 TaxID=2914830 RepID=UPI001F5ADC7B|nr:MarR family transcriptional regulator [Sphingomonas sp. BAUL-RG-20F-R05-02]
MTSVAIAENGHEPAAGRSFASQVALILKLLRKRFDERAGSIMLSDGKPLTRAQWRVLAAIHLREGATQREISETLDIGTVATGQTIDRLEEAEWIERRTDRSDRRVRRLYVKAPAMPALERLGLLSDREEEAVMIGISNEDMQRLSLLLETIIDNLGAKTSV